MATEEETSTSNDLSASLKQFMQEFKGGWRPDPNIMMTTKEWFKQPVTESRRAPRDWLHYDQKLANAIREAPLIHEVCFLFLTFSHFS